MDTAWKRGGRLLFVSLGALLGVAAGFVVFVRYASTVADLAGILLAAALGVFGARAARGTAESVFAPYNVAEVGVEGPITRSGIGGMPQQPTAVPADAIVDRVEDADADPNVDALVVRLNTPGGEVVPSEDIRRSVVDFDGPTVAYATDVCASGGYWIASGCDHVVAREGGLVGSIGVVMSNVNVSDLAERVGVEYERLAAGDYKDAGHPLKEFTDDDRRYLQGLTDDYYEQFVERVTEGRDIDEATVRDTEARVFVGRDALDRGLVDELGDESTVDDYLADRLGEPVDVREFAPSVPLVTRVRRGVERVAYAATAGAVGALADGGLRAR